MEQFTCKAEQQRQRRNGKKKRNMKKVWRVIKPLFRSIMTDRSLVWSHPLKWFMMGLTFLWVTIFRFDLKGYTSGFACYSPLTAHTVLQPLKPCIHLWFPTACGFFHFNVVWKSTCADLRLGRGFFFLFYYFTCRKCTVMHNDTGDCEHLSAFISLNRFEWGCSFKSCHCSACVRERQPE